MFNGEGTAMLRLVLYYSTRFRGWDGIKERNKSGTYFNVPNCIEFILMFVT